MDEETRYTEEARAIEAAGRCAGLTKAKIDQQLEALQAKAYLSVRKRGVFCNPVSYSQRMEDL